MLSEQDSFVCRGLTVRSRSRLLRVGMYTNPFLEGALRLEGHHLTRPHADGHIIEKEGRHIWFFGRQC